MIDWAFLIGQSCEETDWVDGRIECIFAAGPIVRLPGYVIKITGKDIINDERFYQDRPVRVRLVHNCLMLTFL